MKNLLFVFFLFPAVLFSQKIKIEPLTFDFGLTVTRKEGYIITNGWQANKLPAKYIPNISVGNIRYNRYLSSKLYLGYSYLEQYFFKDTLDGGLINVDVIDSHTAFAALQTNVHLLPMLCNCDCNRIDLYASVHTGGAYSFGKFPEPQKIIPEYAAGFGLKLYTGKHFGFFGELYYGKYAHFKNTRSNFGISLTY